MTMGRPTKPNEIKRRAGNPGSRPLKQPIYALPAAVNGVPPAPKGLGAPGKKVWHRIWALGRAWMSPQTDIDIVTRLAQAHDERDMLRQTIAAEGYFTEGSMGQKVVHPAVKELRLVESMMTRWESLCGLNPSDRSRLGMAEVQRVSKLDAFLNRKDPAV